MVSLAPPRPDSGPPGERGGSELSETNSHRSGFPGRLSFQRKLGGGSSDRSVRRRPEPGWRALPGGECVSLRGGRAQEGHERGDGGAKAAGVVAAPSGQRALSG